MNLPSNSIKVGKYSISLNLSNKIDSRTDKATILVEITDRPEPTELLSYKVLYRTIIVGIVLAGINTMYHAFHS